MATSGPLILKGNLKLGASVGSAVEVGDAITQVKLSFTRNMVTIPSTLGSVEYEKAGAAKYQITFDYFSNDQSTTADVFGLLWATATDDDAYMYFEGSMRNTAVSASNPKWAGTFVVSGAQLGGKADDLSTGSVTATLIGAPSRQTS